MPQHPQHPPYPQDLPHTKRLPLTTGQHGIWFAQRLDPANPTYITAEYIDIHGPLDTTALHTTIRSVLTEAQCLHVRCEEDSTGPCQVTDAPPTVPVTVLDLSTEPDPWATADQWMRDDLAHPLDMNHPPLYTQAILSLGEDRHLWYQKFHHLVTDGFSHALIASRVADRYTETTTGTPPAPTAFGPLHDLVQDDTDYQTSPTADTDRAYWQQTMTGAGRAASLSERTAPTPHKHLSDTHHMPPPDFTRLRNAARARRTHWSSLLTTALAAYTHRITGAEDIVLGLPVTARTTPTLKRTPGMTSNLLPLRLHVTPDTTLAELVRHTTTQSRHALKHQRYRYEHLRRDLGLLHDGSALCGPHINVLPFEYDLTFGEATAVSHALATGPVDDLTLTVLPREEGLRLTFNANPGRYTPAELAGHLTRFRTVLDTLLDDPEHPVGDLDILDTAEHNRLLDWAQGGGTTATDPRTLPEAFETQARLRPEHTAVTCEGTTLSYGQLNTRANRLARLLLQADARPGRHVALALPRSHDLVTALLAVLKSGAAYIPVDPDYPPDRITHILHDAQPQLLITTSELAARLPDHGCPRILLDDPDTHTALATLPAHNIDNPERTTPLTTTHPAYVIYTSGSTGNPKGVVVTHHNVMSLLSATRTLFDFGPSDVWTQFHSYAFDFSVWEIWGALLHGSRLVIVPTTVARSPQSFLALLAAEEVTVLNQTPSAFHHLMQAEQDTPDLAQHLALRYVIFGGEALDLSRLAPWYDRHPDDAPQLVNMYGITETTVHATHQPLTAKLVVDTPGSLIGTGLPHVDVHILDRTLRPTPAGITGEIYIGGPQVTNGYLHRPELTEQRFLRHPLAPAGTRLYRTGDLARRLPDGMIEYRGRADDQVKIRGYRIELGEIEAALRALPDVADARALAGTDTVGDTVLRAYTTTTDGAHPEPGTLRTALKNTLPDYMIPATITVVDAFPLTAHGKLDRTALPTPAPTRSQPPTPPTDPLERQITQAWNDALPGATPDGIGIDDDFFDLGGDSFKAVRAARNIGAQATAIDIFQHPTPRRLATHLRTTAQHTTPHPWLRTLTPTRPTPPRLTLICIPYGGGSATAFQQLAACLPPHIELRAAAIPGYDPALPTQEGPPLHEAAAHLAEEITRTVTGPLALYGHCVGTALTLLTARELEDRNTTPHATHLAAALPEPDPHGALATLAAQSDDTLHTYLQSLGGFNGVLDPTDLHRTLTMVRHAMIRGATFQIEAATTWKKLHTPLHIVIGDADPATAGYENTYRAWGHYTHHTHLSVLPGAGHYFVKDHPHPLATTLTTIK